MSDKREDLHKELEIIQGIIARMANNSFLIKGWTMTLISALAAFGKDLIFTPQGGYYLVLMLAILIPFWWLDSFYLRQERLFRKIYDRAVSDPKSKQRTQFDMKPGELNDHVPAVYKIMGSGSVRWFYVPFILLILIGSVFKFAGLW